MYKNCLLVDYGSPITNFYDLFEQPPTLTAQYIILKNGKSMVLEEMIFFVKMDQKYYFGIS